MIERGDCRVCGKNYRLTNSGMVRVHWTIGKRYVESPAGDWVLRPMCAGSRLDPRGRGERTQEKR